MSYADDYQDRQGQQGAPMPDAGTAPGHGSGTPAYGSGTPAYGSGTSAAQPQATDQPQGAQPGKQGRTFTEEFRLSGEAVVAKVKELVREGNVRRIAIKNDDGKVLIEIPLTIGVIGTVLLPVWAAVGAIAAMVANLTITVERVAKPEEPRA